MADDGPSVIGGRMVIVVMGVTGAGKTTVGMRLAKQLRWRFFDADSFHLAVNIAKMRRGIPLTDADREPWLRRVQALIVTLLADRVDAVVACSALTRRYRARLGVQRPGVRLVYLRATNALLLKRLQRRRGHFASPRLLRSQFAILEEPAPEDALILDAAQPVARIVAAIRMAFGLSANITR